MAQNFRRYVFNNVGTSAETIYTADSNDTIVGISVANVASPFMAAAPAAPSNFGLDHDDSRFTSKFDLSLGG